MEILLLTLFIISSLIFFIIGKDDFGRQTILLKDLNIQNTQSDNEQINQDKFEEKVNLTIEEEVNQFQN